MVGMVRYSARKSPAASGLGPTYPVTAYPVPAIFPRTIAERRRGAAGRGLRHSNRATEIYTRISISLVYAQRLWGNEKSDP